MRDYVSQCCKAIVEVINGVEGTSYYRCSACGKPCDFEVDTRKKKE